MPRCAARALLLAAAPAAPLCGAVRMPLHAVKHGRGKPTWKGHGPSPAIGRRTRKGMVRKTVPAGEFDGVAYYADIWLGANLQHQRVQFDSGSADLAVSSQECPTCIKHRFTKYQPQYSGQPVGCDDCDTRYVSISCDYSTNNQCTYENSYGDQSGFVAEVYDDKLAFWGDASASDMITTKVAAFASQHPGPGQKSFEPYDANGIMGVAFHTISSMGAVNPIFTYTQAHGLPEVFSMSVGPAGTSDPGEVSIGEILPHDSSIHWEPVVIGKGGVGKGGYWSVVVTDVLVDGDSIGVPASTYTTGSCIVDSGTTDVTLPSAAFAALKKQLLDAGIDERVFDGYCLGYTPDDFHLFPTITIQMQQTSIKLKAEDYMSKDICGGQAYGIAIDEMDDTILGLPAHKVGVVVYDKGNMQVGWASESASGNAPAAGPPAPAPGPQHCVADTPTGGCSSPPCSCAAGKVSLEWSASVGGSCFTCADECKEEPTQSCTSGDCGCLEGWVKKEWDSSSGKCYTCIKTCKEEPTDSCTHSKCGCKDGWELETWNSKSGGHCYTCDASSDQVIISVSPTVRVPRDTRRTVAAGARKRPRVTMKAAAARSRLPDGASAADLGTVEKASPPSRAAVAACAAAAAAAVAAVVLARRRPEQAADGDGEPVYGTL